MSQKEKIVKDLTKQSVPTPAGHITEAEIIAVMATPPSKHTPDQKDVYKRVLFIIWDKSGRIHCRVAFPGFKKWSQDFLKFCNVKEIAAKYNSGYSRKTVIVPLPEVVITKESVGHILAQVKKTLTDETKRNAFVADCAANKPLTVDKCLELTGKYCKVNKQIPEKEEVIAAEIMQPEVSAPAALETIPVKEEIIQEPVQPAIIPQEEIKQEETVTQSL